MSKNLLTILINGTDPNEDLVTVIGRSLLVIDDEDLSDFTSEVIERRRDSLKAMKDFLLTYGIDARTCVELPADAKKYDCPKPLKILKMSAETLARFKAEDFVQTVQDELQDVSDDAAGDVYLSDAGRQFDEIDK